MMARIGLINRAVKTQDEQVEDEELMDEVINDELFNETGVGGEEDGDDQNG